MMSKFLLGANGRAFLSGGRPLTAIGDAAASSGATSLTLNDIKVGNTLAKPMYQRKAGTENNADGGYVDAPVFFTYTGAVPAVQGRVVNADNSAVIRDWAALVTVQVDDTAKTGNGFLPTVPIGADYLLQIRDSTQPANSATTSNGTQRWGVGVAVGMDGQSNEVNSLQAGMYNDPIPGRSDYNEYTNWTNPDFAGVYFGLGGFVVPQNLPGSSGSNLTAPGIDPAGGGGSAFLRLIADGLKRKYGRKIPVCGVIWAFNGTGLEEMTPPNGGKTQIYTNSGTGNGAIGFRSPRNFTPGDYEIVVRHQGEANNGQPRATRLAAEKAFFQSHLDVVAPLGRTAQSLTFLPAVLGVYTQCDQIETIRGAVYDLETYAKANNWPRVRAGVNCIDFDTLVGTSGSDAGLHFADQYRKQNIRRQVQDVYKALGISTYGGNGPRISGVTRAGLVATVTVQHEGGTALAVKNAGAPSGWYANTAADFSGTDITVTAAIASANTVSVTFPSGTAFPVYLKHMGGKLGTMQSQHPDVSNPIYDNVSYPEGAIGTDLYTGLPLNPTPDALVVN